MLLVSATAGPFKSINSPQEVEIDSDVTVLVGMNEAGKTVFLKALSKSADVLGIDKFDPIDDYPRKDLPAYLRIHEKTPAQVTVLKFQLSDGEVAALNSTLGTKVPKGFTFTVDSLYNNTRRIGISVDESPAVAALAASKSLSTDAAAAIKKATTVKDIPAALASVPYRRRPDIPNRSASSNCSNSSELDLRHRMGSLAVGKRPVAPVSLFRRLRNPAQQDESR